MAAAPRRGPAAPRAIVKLKPADVVNGRAMTGEQSERFRAAVNDMEKGAATDTTPEDAALVSRGRQSLRGLARELGVLDELDRMEGYVAETARLRTAMNDAVLSRAGRVRVLDGIDHAHSIGALAGLGVTADNLLKLGVTYRGAYEATSGMLTPERQEVRGGGGGADDVLMAQGKALETMRARQTMAHVEVLDAVCGMDLMMGKAARRLRRDPRTIKRLLREALTTAALNMGVAWA
jgi:hypothetical protein